MPVITNGTASAQKAVAPVNSATSFSALRESQSNDNENAKPAKQEDQAITVPPSSHAENDGEPGGTSKSRTPVTDNLASALSADNASSFSSNAQQLSEERSIPSQLERTGGIISAQQTQTAQMLNVAKPPVANSLMPGKQDPPKSSTRGYTPEKREETIPATNLKEIQPPIEPAPKPASSAMVAATSRQQVTENKAASQDSGKNIESIATRSAAAADRLQTALQAEKRKWASPPSGNIGEERPSNRPKHDSSDNIRLGQQQRPTIPSSYRGEVALPNSNRQTSTKLAVDANGKPSYDKDDPVPADKINHLICLFVGNIPPSSGDPDLRAWIFSSRDVPRPVAITPLGQAKGDPGAPQFLRIFFETMEDAQRAMAVLNNTRFNSPPAQLVLRILPSQPKKVRLHWRDVESWARGRLDGIQRIANDNNTKPPSLKTAEQAAQRDKLREDQERSRQSYPLSAPVQDNQSTGVTKSVENLADRLELSESRSDKRRETERPHHQQNDRPGHPAPLGKETVDTEKGNLLNRVKGTKPEDVHPQRNPEHRTRATSESLFSRFDASPPRRRNDHPRYTPPREDRHTASRRSSTNLLGRLE